MDKPEDKFTPERTARKIVMDCADCDCCRPIMDESCLFFRNCTGFTTRK